MTLRFGHFFLALVAVGLLAGYFLNGWPDRFVSFAAALGYALIPIVVACLIGLFTFRDKQGTKGPIGKALIPSLLFGIVWAVIWLGFDDASAAHVGPEPMMQRAFTFGGIAALLAFLLATVMGAVLRPRSRAVVS